MRSNSSFFRTIDANMNRLKEGIRVVEDILRYEYNSPLSKELKNLRHQVRDDEYEDIVLARDVNKDILKKTILSEEERKDLEDVIIANLKRAQESARVLEELNKFRGKGEKYKKIRYALYALEKEIISFLKSS